MALSLCSGAMLTLLLNSYTENFVRTLIQHRYNLGILDIGKLSALLNRLRIKARLAELQNQLTYFSTSLSSYVHENPKEAVFALLCIVTMLTVPVILPAIGFGAVGPAAGSLAAAWQSSIGIVAAGSPFAFLQSAAMGGAAAGVIYGSGVAGLAVLAAKRTAEWTYTWWRKRNDE